MANVIHGASHKALKFFRKAPAALAVYWIYASRTNNEGVAWPSLRGLSRDTGWSVNACSKAREWLVKHGALERVTDYKRPNWRKLDAPQRQQKINLDRSEYYRPTGQIVVDGNTYPLLYFGQNEPSDIEDDTPDVSPQRTSAARDVAPDDTELDSSTTKLDSNKPIVASEAATVAADKPDKQVPSKKTEKERNPLFDAVAIHVFGIDAGLVNGDGGRVGAIAAWLGGKSDGTKRGRSAKAVVGYISKPATPEHIRKFVAWYMSKHTASVPRDFEKFVEYWRQWATETNKQQARRSQPVAQVDAPRKRTAEEQAQIEAMLKDIRPEWEKDAA